MKPDETTGNTDGDGEDAFAQFISEPVINENLTEKSSISDSPEAAVGNLINELDALAEAGYDTNDAGTRLSDSEIAPFLDTTQKEASEAGHDFRTDAQGEFGMPEYRG
jgi:hypothetical protein